MSPSSLTIWMNQDLPTSFISQSMRIWGMKKELMISKKLLEISRTEVRINPHPQRKRNKKEKEKNISVNRHCPGELRVITYNGGQGVDGRCRGGWLINPAHPIYRVSSQFCLAGGIFFLFLLEASFSPLKYPSLHLMSSSFLTCKCHGNITL